MPKKKNERIYVGGFGLPRYEAQGSDISLNVKLCTSETTAHRSIGAQTIETNLRSPNPILIRLINNHLGSLPGTRRGGHHLLRRLLPVGSAVSAKQPFHGDLKRYRTEHGAG
jgi:hypothetical protein